VYKLKGTKISREHPLRKLFRKALDFGLKHNPSDKKGIAEYIEEHILSEFIHIENLYKIKDAKGKKLDDIADLLAEGELLLNAQSVLREFHVHKHIGDLTLFMLGMFPSFLKTRKGKEFILGRIIIPGSTLSDLYMLQGRRSYKIASGFTHKDLFLELSSNFILYRNVLDLVRIYLESLKNKEFFKVKQILGGTA
jgi:hypothetical protein